MGKTKQQKLKQKLQLMERMCNEMITAKERAEKDLSDALSKPAKKIKKDPTAAQKKVQDQFSRRAKIASDLYHAEGAKLTWPEAMTAAGPLLKAELLIAADTETAVVNIENLTLSE